MARRVPPNAQSRHPPQTDGLDHLCRDRSSAFKIPGYRRQGRPPPPCLGAVIVSLKPVLHGDERTNDFFLADLHGAAERLMRRAIDPCRFDKTPVTDQESGRMGAA